MTTRHVTLFVLAVGAPLIAGCATGYERSGRSQLDSVRFYPGGTTARSRSKPLVTLDGTLPRYVAYALSQNPSLRASFETWRASVERIASTRQLPEPSVSYGLFVRRVETRVGPQRHRFSLRQMLPWPSKLTSAAGAASSTAKAAERRFRARALAVRARVATAYWRLWLIDREYEIQSRQRELLKGLSTAVRARVAVGKAGLSALSQVDLSVTTLDDRLRTLKAKRAVARAKLIDAIGAPEDTPTPLKGSKPPAGLPVRTQAALRQMALAHPAIGAFGHEADAEREHARNARSRGRPDLMLGFDFIETGPASMPGVVDSGKDPIVLSIGLTLPIWTGAYASRERSALARAAAWTARGRAARNRALASLNSTLALLRDSHRRIATYRKTLIPQAETTYSAVVGTFQTGASSLAAVLIAERDLLNLRLALVRARADHATAWAVLEQLIGESIAPKEPS